MPQPVLSWMYASELPLPAGLAIEVINTADVELGKQRLEGMTALVGKETAEALAEKLGSYELGEEEAKGLKMKGLQLGKNDELPALSPARWKEAPDSQFWAHLRARLHEKRIALKGLSLNASQREAFLNFMARNRVSADEELELEAIVGLARHFFFSEPINVVVRYTGPRFHHA